MEKRTFDSPFDPKWEMSPEDIAKVFSQNTEPELVPAEDKAASEKDERLSMFKQLLIQDYFTLLIAIQVVLNKIYKHPENLSKDIYKDQITALKNIRSNSNTLLELALKSKNAEDIGVIKLTFYDLAKQVCEF